MTEDLNRETLYERAEHAARTVRTRVGDDVRVALVLGSGLGAFADELEDADVQLVQVGDDASTSSA